MGEERETVECEKCNGNGWIPNPEMDTRDPYSPDHIDCEDCGGDGWNYV